MTKSLITDKKGRQWFEETVVVRKEGDGYGITLAEAQPVFIQRTVKNGPADKAGVQVGDRIVKVNGLSIMSKSHTEVVSMVKNSSFVSFTLMRKVQSSGTKEDSGQSKPIAGNGFVPLLEQQSKMSRDSSAFSLQNLKTVLQKKRTAYEKLAVQFSKTHDDSLINEIMDHQLIIQDLEQQIAAQSPSINSHIKATQASIAAMRGHQRSHSDSGKLAKLIEQQTEREAIQASLPQPSTTAPAKHPIKVVTISDVVEKYGPPKQSRFWNPFSSSESKGKSSSTSNITAPPPPSSQSPPSPIKGKDATMDISPISSDNEEDMNISEGVSPFQSLQVLKTAPAHMATFLCYMLGMKNKDPTKLCFYLVIQSYQDTRCKPVEMKQRALDIYLTFMHPNSPLYLDLGEKHEGIASRILNTIQNEELPMKLTPVFKDVRGMIQQSIENDLVEFQQKRMIGLGWMFGDQKLSEHMSQEEIVEVVYSNLQKPLKDLMEDMEDKELPARNRILALASCVATFMLDLGRPKNKANEPVNFEKLSSITKCDVRKMKQKRKSEVRQGHQLLPTIFSTYVLCDKCSQLIWSIGVHGMQCSYCDVNVHYAEECMSEIPPCSRDKKKKHNKRSPTESSESYYEELEERQAEWDALNGSSASFPDVRSPVTKERSQSLTETKLPTIPHVGEFRGRTHQVNRTLSDRIPDKPLPPGRLQSLDASLTSSASITSFPGVRLHGMDEVRGRSGGQLSPLPEIVKSSPIDADVEVDLQDNDLNVKDELVPWALAVGKEVVEKYNKHEKQRQELIREFVHTEKTHLKKLKVMLYLYKKPLIRQKIISYERVLQLFPNLEELILIHGMLLTDLKGREADSGVHVEGISDILLQRFDGEAGERLNKACAVFASNQAMAVRLFKEWKKTDERFKHFVKVAESHPMCGRLKLAELIPIPWTRLTKYRLLVEGIVAEYKTQVKKGGVLPDKGQVELDRLETVLSRIKSILHDVNVQVKSTENHCKLLDYQAKLDTSGLEKSSNKLANFYGNLDITEGRQLLHEGSLTWKLQNKKIELHALLLTDILVLMEKDIAHDRFFLRTHTQMDFKGGKDELCPVVKVSETLWRDAATDRSKRTFFLASNSPLMQYAVKYELLAESAAKREEWCVAFHNATTAVAKANHGDEDSMSYVSSDTTMSPLRSPSPTSPQPRDPDTLYKIDEAIVKLLEDKMAIVRGMNTKDERILKEASVESVESIAPELDTPVNLARAAIEQACIMVSAANAFLVPDQQIPSFSTAQTAIAEHAVTLQRHLTALMRVLTGSVDQQEDDTRRGSTHTLVAELRIDSPSSEQTPQEELKPNDADTAPVISGTPDSSPSSVLDRKESEEDENDEDEDSEQVATVQDNVIMLFDPSDNPEIVETNVVGESVGGDKSDSDDADIPPPLPEVPPPPESPLCPEDTNHFSLLTDESNVLISQLLKSGNSQTSLSSYTEDDGTLIAPPPPPLFAADLDHEMPTLFEVPKANNSDKENQPLTDNSVDDNNPPPLPSGSPPEMDTLKNMPKDMRENTPTCDGRNVATTGIFLQEQGSSEA